MPVSLNVVALQAAATAAALAAQSANDAAKLVQLACESCIPTNSADNYTQLCKHCRQWLQELTNRSNNGTPQCARSLSGLLCVEISQQFLKVSVS